MNALRPPTHTLNLGIQALALLAIYLVIPNRRSTRLTMAVLVMTLVAAMQLSGRREVDIATRTLIWTTVLLTNVLGLTLAARFESVRRQQFLGRLRGRAHP